MKSIPIVLIIGINLALVGCNDRASAAKSSSQASSLAVNTEVNAKITAAEKAAPQKPPSDIELLLKEIDDANSECRGKPGGSPESDAGCEKRTRLMANAKELGWCWGPSKSYGYEQHWMRCSDDTDYVAKRQWYSPDINHSDCIASRSPADRMREIQSSGTMPSASNLPGGAVEIEVEIGNGRSRVWKYYPSLAACEASLPKSQAIDKRFE